MSFLISLNLNLHVFCSNVFMESLTLNRGQRSGQPHNQRLRNIYVNKLATRSSYIQYKRHLTHIQLVSSVFLTFMRYGSRRFTWMPLLAE